MILGAGPWQSMLKHALFTSLAQFGLHWPWRRFGRGRPRRQFDAVRWPSDCVACHQCGRLLAGWVCSGPTADHWGGSLGAGVGRHGIFWGAHHHERFCHRSHWYGQRPSVGGEPRISFGGGHAVCLGCGHGYPIGPLKKRLPKRGAAKVNCWSRFLGASRYGCASKVSKSASCVTAAVLVRRSAVEGGVLGPQLPPPLSTMPMQLSTPFMPFPLSSKKMQSNPP